MAMNPIDITAAGAAGTHTIRRVTVNTEDNYLYFKDNNYVSTIPSTLTNGTGFIYGEGVGAIGGISDGALIFANIVSPTQVQLDSDDQGTAYDLAESVAGVVSFNTPVVFDGRLNIDSSTASNQAVKYYTNGDPLTGLTSGETYFLRNVSVSDFAGQQSLYTIDDQPADPISQAQFVSPGTFSWTAPEGVTEVSVVAVGGCGGGVGGNAAGSGAGGGGLGWRNRVSVVPGQNYTVVVGVGGALGNNVGGNGGTSYFIDTNVVAGFGGIGGVANSTSTRSGGGFTGDGGGSGGDGGTRRSNDSAGGGGGAGGYSGNGGRGGGGVSVSQAGAGGGGGGGGYAGSADTAGAGGGVGIFGQGADGAAGANSNTDGLGGQGGSGGGNGNLYGSTTGDRYNTSTVRATPGLYGGGASAGDNTATNERNAGGGGAVRIIWGSGRTFPSTRTANE